MEPPNAQIEDLIADFKARQWESAPLEKALLLATTTPESIASLVQRVMYALPRDGRFLDAALAFLPEGEWPELVRSAIEYMKTDPDNKAAEIVLECAVLQCVQAVHPYLSDLFFLSAWLDNSYGAYAWRESEAKHPAFLPEFLYPVVLSTNMAEARKWAPRAFDALLETRLPEAMKSACASYRISACTSQWT